MREFYQEARVERPIAEVFRFFSDPGNLARLTPPSMGLEMELPVGEGMREGLEMSYRVRVRGIPMRWRGRITVWDPPRRFVDIQLWGPYRRWEHEHGFEEVEGGTRVTDRIRYAVWGGEWVDRWVVRPEMERMFEYRTRRLQELMPSLVNGVGT